MLGHLRMNVDEAIDALINVASAVFAEESQDVIDPEANSEHLEESIEEMLQTRGIPFNAKMHERDHPQTRCKVYVYSSYTFIPRTRLLLVLFTRQHRPISTTLRLFAHM
jgi:hypothetical protein